MQVDRKAHEPARLRKPVPDNPVEQIDIDIAAADEHYHTLAAQVRLDFERTGERGCARALGEEFHPFEHQQHRFADLEIVDRHNTAYTVANQFKRQTSNPAGCET